MTDFIPPWSFLEKGLSAVPAILSAIIAGWALRWNRKRERHHFRVCCQCLREEVASHQGWIKLILHGTPLSKEIVLSQSVAKDFNHLKYDDAFRYMPVEDFRAIFAYYQSIEMQQFLLQRIADRPFSDFVRENDLQSLLESRERILKILEYHIAKRAVKFN